MVDCVYLVYLCSSKAKDMETPNRASFKIRPELRKAFEIEAKKKQWTLSYYIEQICESFAKTKKMKV